MLSAENKEKNRGGEAGWRQGENRWFEIFTSEGREV